MGRIRVRSRLREVTALLPGGQRRLAAERFNAAGAVLTWENFALADVGFSMTQANKLVNTLSDPIHAISIRYLSPLKIKEQGQWVKRPDLGAVMRASCAPTAHSEPGAW